MEYVRGVPRPAAAAQFVPAAATTLTVRPIAKIVAIAGHVL
jgi:hypothetical protein